MCGGISRSTAAGLRHSRAPGKSGRYQDMNQLDLGEKCASVRALEVAGRSRLAVGSGGSQTVHRKIKVRFNVPKLIEVTIRMEDGGWPEVQNPECGVWSAESMRGWRIDDGGWQKAERSTPNIQLPTPSQGQSRPVKAGQTQSRLSTPQIQRRPQIEGGLSHRLSSDSRYADGVKAGQTQSSLSTSKNSRCFHVFPAISGYFRLAGEKKVSVLQRKSTAGFAAATGRVERRGKRWGKYLPGRSLPRIRLLSPKRDGLKVISRAIRNVRLEPINGTWMGGFPEIGRADDRDGQRASPWEFASFISRSNGSMDGFGPAKLQMVHI